VRAFDLDERLVGVAFLDVGVYVTCMRSMKNALLIGDAVKGVWFIAFQVAITPFLFAFVTVLKTMQEDPFKLVVLGKHAQHTSITNIDFFFRDGQIAVVAGDDEGVIRLFEYDPTSMQELIRDHDWC
jgi:cleavage and polyadenylation specificity factor subunit 1